MNTQDTHNNRAIAHAHVLEKIQFHTDKINSLNEEINSEDSKITGKQLTLKTQEKARLEKELESLKVLEETYQMKEDSRTTTQAQEVESTQAEEDTLAEQEKIITDDLELFKAAVTSEEGESQATLINTFPVFDAIILQIKNLKANAVETNDSFNKMSDRLEELKEKLEELEKLELDTVRNDVQAKFKDLDKQIQPVQSSIKELFTQFEKTSNVVLMIGLSFGLLLI